MGLLLFFVWARHMFLTATGTAIQRIFQATTSDHLDVGGRHIALALMSGGSILFTTPMFFARVARSTCQIVFVANASGH
jgi:hypothetical protein